MSACHLPGWKTFLTHPPIALNSHQLLDWNILAPTFPWKHCLSFWWIGLICTPSSLWPSRLMQCQLQKKTCTNIKTASHCKNILTEPVNVLSEILIELFIAPSQVPAKSPRQPKTFWTSTSSKCSSWLQGFLQSQVERKTCAAHSWQKFPGRNNKYFLGYNNK